MPDTHVKMNLEHYIRKEFIECHRNFNVVHVNAESLHAHFRDFTLTFNKERYIHAILVSETFLKPHMANYDLPNYTLIRNDRTMRGRGGVAIYLRSDINYEIIQRSQQSTEIVHEYILIKVDSPVQILLGVYYRSPRTSEDISSFVTLLERLRTNGLWSEAIIMGDFNIDQFAKNNKLPSVLNRVGLKILQSAATNHQPNRKPSHIDLTIVSNENNVARHGKLAAIFSYHDLIFVSYKIGGKSYTELLLPPRIYIDIPESTEENDLRSEILCYKIDYNSTRSIESLKNYQNNEEWKKYKDVWKRKINCENMNRTYRPRRNTECQHFFRGKTIII